MTPALLAAIKARLAAADDLLDRLGDLGFDQDDADTLDDIRADLPALVAEVERLNAQITAVVADCDAARADALRLHGEAVAAITRAERAGQALALAEQSIASATGGVYCTQCGDQLITDGDDNLCWVCVGTLKARAEAADAQVEAFGPYLKDGETPIERLERERADNDTLMGLLAKEKAHIDNAMRVEARRIAARDREIADLQIERSLADRATAAARADRDRFQAERDALKATLATAERERDEARKDAAYHAECRPNRQRAEAAMAVAKATNDRWANAIAERDRLRELLREVEWQYLGYGYSGICVSCHRLKMNGHALDCRLKAALEGK